MNTTDRYIQKVVRNIYAPAPEKARIEADLRAHFQEALETGETFEAMAARMGDPVEVAAGFMAEIPLVYAGFGRRLAAFMIDMALMILVVFGTWVLWVVLSDLVPQEPQGLEYILGGLLIAVLIGSALFAIGLLIFYFPLLEGRFGQTLGKRLLGLRVLKESGLPAGYREAFLRRISYYFEVILLDALFIPFTPKRQRAFDIVARTVVVIENSAGQLK
jgi:uncharacterized RDD family membrane protein YckC